MSGKGQASPAPIPADHRPRLGIRIPQPTTPCLTCWSSHQDLTSVEVIQSLPGKDVRAWLAYYTGRSAQQILEADRRGGYTGGDQDWCSQDLRRALRACTGVEPVFML